MDINIKGENNKIIWHHDTLPPKTKKALDILSKEEWLSESGWYLAGGTALTLQVGNRKSVDLDFFTTKKSFLSKRLISHFKKSQNWKIELEENDTVYCTLNGAKISFIAYPFFIPKQKFSLYGSIKVLNPIDIGVMKITAISQRGRKRDFFDLYWCANNIEPLEKIIKRLKVQYPMIAHDYHHILKSLVYFEDAENDPEPEIFFSANWKQVKNFFKKEVPLITLRII